MRNTFTDNLEAFQMATEFNIGEKRYLFSHAGIHPDWARKHSSLFGPLEKVTAETFNQLMFMPEFVDALAEVSWRRGGTAPVGSMIWADIYEYELSAPIAHDVVQICGHTRLPEGKQKELNGVICLDCRGAAHVVHASFQKRVMCIGLIFGPGVSGICPNLVEVFSGLSGDALPGKASKKKAAAFFEAGGEGHFVDAAAEHFSEPFQTAAAALGFD